MELGCECQDHVFSCQDEVPLLLAVERRAADDLTSKWRESHRTLPQSISISAVKVVGWMGKKDLSGEGCEDGKCWDWDGERETDPDAGVSGGFVCLRWCVSGK